MSVVIRENIEEYMDSLREWLRETEDCFLEEMSDFFTERLAGYEEHMSVWKKDYERFASFLPETCGNILDLGCGTGLELEEIWKRNPSVSVTGIDLCRSMLDKLQEKYRGRPLTVIYGDYLRYDPGREQWDAVISFESLHHFLPEQKQALCRKVYQSLKEGAVFLYGDYIACCREEEELLRGQYLEKRKRFNIPEEIHVHFDIPLTLEHETRLLYQAGFSEVSADASIDGVTIMKAEKRR